MDLTDKKELEWTNPPTEWKPPSAAVVINQQSEPSKIDAVTLSQVLLHGDLRRLTAEQKIQYYKKVCELVGLNPLTQPFAYIVLNNKEVLYALKGCAEQLRAIHGVSFTESVAQEDKENSLWTVNVKGVDGKGRTDTGTGVVSIKGLSGLDLANARMKADTKAKRRLTLSICGLNMLDETEVEDLSYKFRYDHPAEDDGVAPTGYVIPFGKWVRRSIEEVYEKEGSAKIGEYIDYLIATADKKGKPIIPGGPIDDLIKRFEAYCGAMDNVPIENGEDQYDEPGSSG